MERYAQFLKDIKEARESRERYAELGLTELVNAFDEIILKLTLVLSAELEANQYVQAYKSLCEQEKAVVAQKLQYEELSEEVKIYKELHATF